MIEVLAKGFNTHTDEAVIKKWFYEEGDTVSEGDDLVELMAEDSSVTIQAPASGILAEVYFDEGDAVQRDEVICVIDDEEGSLDEEDEEDADDER